ncbi:MAG: acyl carrier protein [Alphaproteobacteria bacterium]|nr:acyl carrier protein [Alphaproteobacteria bacterium]
MDEDAVRGLIADHLGVSPALVLDPVEFRSLGADSLDLVSLTMRLEEALDLEISDDQAERCLRVGDAMQLVRTSLQGQLDDVQVGG